MTEPRIRTRKPDPPMTDTPFDGCPEIDVPGSMLTVMGIDASLTATGLAVINDKRLYSEVWSPPKDQNRGVTRLSWFRQQVLLAAIRYQPDVVFVEGYGFGAKSRAHSLGELGGVVKLALLDSAVPVGIVPPTVLKLFATGKGNAEKDTVSKELFKRFGVDLMNNNAVDAAGLAVMALAHLDGLFRDKLTKPQLRAMERIEE